MALEQEQAAYRRKLQNLLPSAGKYVVINEDKVVGVYDTYNDAVTVAYEKLGMRRFMVKQITSVEHASRFTRDIATCRSCAS